MWLSKWLLAEDVVEWMEKKSGRGRAMWVVIAKGPSVD